MTSLDLGVDAGGERSAWALSDRQGEVVRRGPGPHLHVAMLDPGAVAQQLRAILHAAAEAAGGVHPGAMVVSLSGPVRPTVRAAIRAALDLPFPSAVVGDVEAVGATCLHAEPGVAVWAGRDSFAVARDADGRLVRVGGRGWLLDDRGSAFALVRSAAAAVIEAAEGVGPATGLTEAMVHAFSVADPLQLGGALQREWPGEVAAAVPEVLAVADDGDLVANRVLREEARALAARARAAVRRAMLAEEETPISFGGSVLRASDLFAELLRDALGQLGFTREPARAERAEVGAARLAAALRSAARPLCSWIDDERAA
jgi:N-acetylglucosamine kinase-like BadF-type ATPase